MEYEINWLPKWILRQIEVQDSGCWNWTGWVSKKGYGGIPQRGSYPDQAYRVVWESLEDDVPYGLHLDHLCRNSLCVNPKHLEPVEPAENRARIDFEYRVKVGALPRETDPERDRELQARRLV